MKNLEKPDERDWLPFFCGSAFGLAVVVILIITMLSGCSILWGNPGDAAKMTPEQIQALKERGFEVFNCTIFAGPPPSGKIINIIVPKREGQPVPPITFGENCQVIR